MYDIVFFDLDGTIINSECGVLNAVEYALKKHGANVPQRAQLKSFIGPPLENEFAVLLGITRKEAAETLVKYYREYYSQKGIFEIELYPFVVELLEKIKKSGRKTVIATSKPEEFALKILKHLNIDKYFDVIAGATFDNSRSEKPDVIRYALEKVGNKGNQNIVMVGDRKYDCQGAKEFQMDSIGVLYGFGDYDELKTAGATYIAKTVEEIYKYL